MLFRPYLESPSEMSLVGGTRGHKSLIINNSPDIKLSVSRDTGLVLKISLLGEGGSGIFGAAVAGRARFCMSSMHECNTAVHTWLI